jgi:hypothetical protein
MKLKTVLRKWNNILHRDIGYFFFGVTIIYGLSGIALNHKVINKWNAGYIVNFKEFKTELDLTDSINQETTINKLLSELGEKENFKKFYFPNENQLKIFLEDGSILIDTKTGIGEIETLKKRPVFNQVNYLHYNPSRWWMYFSDLFAGSLMFLAITGLFVIKGKNGIKWRGLILASAGLIIPILFLFLLR